MNQKLKSIAGLIATLSLIFLIPYSNILPFILLPLWFLIYRPLQRSEILIFAIASVFIIGQNYSVLKSGGFTFTQQDFFLMPYYEPFMWGFYYINMKRFFSEGDKKEQPGLEIKAFIGLAATGTSFSFFSKTSDSLLLATLLSTLLLVIFFHEKYDLLYGCYALFLGFVIEIFGVFTGLWFYPDPDLLGMPYWFATMWISVGILGRRFLIPLSQWIDTKLVKFGR